MSDREAFDQAVVAICNAVYGDPQAGISDDGDTRFELAVREMLATFAASIPHAHQEEVEYLRAENRELRRQLGRCLAFVRTWKAATRRIIPTRLRNDLERLAVELG